MYHVRLGTMEGYSSDYSRKVERSMQITRAKVSKTPSQRKGSTDQGTQKNAAITAAEGKKNLPPCHEPRLQKRSGLHQKKIWGNRQRKLINYPSHSKKSNHQRGEEEARKVALTRCSVPTPSILFAIRFTSEKKVLDVKGSLSASARRLPVLGRALIINFTLEDKRYILRQLLPLWKVRVQQRPTWGKKILEYAISLSTSEPLSF
mmetsp:Transcript_10271/g.22846  ORF Transcript_10271/g.22846 Transcript_10271/m.22846 type:complete len:205 (-) Transcript_10271:270-884(-)